MAWNYLSFCRVTAERDFLDSLPFSQQCTKEEEELLRFLYENKLKKVKRFFILFQMLFLLFHQFEKKKNIPVTEYWFTYFSASLCQYNKPSEIVVPDIVNGLQDNLDVVVSLAERHYYNCDFKMCYTLTSM